MRNIRCMGIIYRERDRLLKRNSRKVFGVLRPVTWFRKAVSTRVLSEFLRACPYLRKVRIDPVDESFLLYAFLFV